MVDGRSGGPLELRVGTLEGEMLRQRERTHKLAEMVQTHEGRVALTEWEVRELKGDVAKLATAEQLRHLSEQMDPIRRGVYGVIWVVIAAVLSGILALVMRGGPPTP